MCSQHFPYEYIIQILLKIDQQTRAEDIGTILLDVVQAGRREMESREPAGAEEEKRRRAGSRSQRLRDQTPHTGAIRGKRNCARAAQERSQHLAQCDLLEPHAPRETSF